MDNLIQRTETEVTVEGTGESTHAFTFAKIWTADKDDMEDVPDDDPAGNDAPDSWAVTLARIADDQRKRKEAEATGRGVRRKATNMPVKPQVSRHCMPSSDYGAHRSPSNLFILATPLLRLAMARENGVDQMLRSNLLGGWNHIIRRMMSTAMPRQALKTSSSRMRPKSLVGSDLQDRPLRMMRCVVYVVIAIQGLVK